MGPSISNLKNTAKQKSVVEGEVSTGTSHHNRAMKKASISQPYVSPQEIRQKLEDVKMGRAQKKNMVNEANKQTSEFMKEGPIQIPKTSIIPEKVLNPPVTEVKKEPVAVAEVKKEPVAEAEVKKEPAPEHVVPNDDHLLVSDVSKNDPNSPETTEKLKSILSTGAFQFNEKEREALSKILEK